MKKSTFRLIWRCVFLLASTAFLWAQIATSQADIEAGNLAAAWQSIQEALAKHPRDGGLLNLRGVVHARRNELAEARRDFADAARFSPQLTPAWQNLARACRQLADVPCAVEAWQRVLRREPANTEARASLADIYEEQGKFAQSLRQLDVGKSENLELRCLDLAGLDRLAEAKAQAALLAKQADFSAGDFAAMRGPLDAPKAAAVVVVLAEALDARGAAGFATLQRLTVAYEQLHRPGDARRTLERVAQLDPTNTAHLLELARLAEESKDHAGALGYLAHARDLAPDMARIHFLFGLIAGEMDLPIEARQSLDKALALEPDNPDYNYAMGSVILETRDAATAASYFAKFVEAKPGEAKGHFALGVAEFASGDYGKAKQEMRDAETSNTVAPAAEYYLGRIARLEGDLDEASLQLHRSLKSLPTFPEAHTELARIAMLKGDLGEAHLELNRALQLKPESFQANEELLVLYKRTGDARAAAQAELLKKLDADRSKRADLMLRTLEMRPQ
jgi:tetratricopeptide (TPR) repeat protein